MCAEYWRRKDLAGILPLIRVQLFLVASPRWCNRLTLRAVALLRIEGWRPLPEQQVRLALQRIVTRLRGLPYFTPRGESETFLPKTGHLVCGHDDPELYAVGRAGCRQDPVHLH
jgi:hypothetical protein